MFFSLRAIFSGCLAGNKLQLGIFNALVLNWNTSPLAFETPGSVDLDLLTKLGLIAMGFDVCQDRLNNPLPLLVYVFLPA